MWSVPTSHWQAAQRALIIDPVTNAANIRRLCASILVLNGFTRWPCTRHNAQKPSTVCRKYRLDPESKKHVQQQNVPKALDISSLEFYPLLCSSIYPSVAVHVSHNGCRRSKTKPSSVNKLIVCHCQQISSVSVNKLFNCRQSLNQSNSNKPSLQKRP